MPHPILKEARSLEEAFFLKHDASLIEEMRRREAAQTQKKALREVSGINDDKLLDELIHHEIHAETLAAFSLVPVIEVAWADGSVQPGEEAVILKAVEESGISKGTVAFHLAEEWMKHRPEPRLMECWQQYTGALMAELNPESREEIKETVLKHAHAVAKAAGGFLGYGRVSKSEEAILDSLEKAFEIRR